jgi:hypothetical protein
MKVFFKITKSKIILGLIIMAMNIATAFYSAIAVLCTQGCPVPNSIQKLFSPAIQPFIIFILLGDFFDDMKFLPGIAMAMLTLVLSGIILLFFWYFIACLLIKLYSLISKKIIF